MEKSFWCTLGIMMMWVLAPIATLPWVAASIVPELSVLEAMPGPAAVDEPGIQWRASDDTPPNLAQAPPRSGSTSSQAQRNDRARRGFCSRTLDWMVWLSASVVIFARICCTQHQSFSTTVHVPDGLIMVSMVLWMCGAVSVAIVELLTDSLTVALMLAVLSALVTCVVSEGLAETRGTDTVWSASLSGLVLGLLEGTGCIVVFKLVGAIDFIRTYVPMAVAGQMLSELLLSMEDDIWSTPRAARFHVQGGCAGVVCLSACALRRAAKVSLLSRVGPHRSAVSCKNDVPASPTRRD
mmetsp:Transcript_113494/g.260390  ORF Transcript_113494/g.260390 Transcript_113494/m.260390 type:complete len:296 (-) Transcript_113494:939-1826(-)